MCESKSILPNCSFKQKQQTNLKFTNIKTQIQYLLVKNKTKVHLPPCRPGNQMAFAYGPISSRLVDSILLVPSPGGRRRTK